MTNILLASALPDWGIWVIMAVVLVGMILLTIIPQKKRQKQQQEMMNSLAVGTKIMTIGRMVGKITQINADNTLVINVGTENNPTLIVIDRNAVGLVLENVAAPAPAPAPAPVVEEAPAKEETSAESAEDKQAGEVAEDVAPAADEAVFPEESAAEEAPVSKKKKK